MTPLVFHSAIQDGNTERSERSWPVGDRKAGVIAGDERSGNDQQKRGAGHKGGENVVRTVVGCLDGFQKIASNEESGAAPLHAAPPHW